MGLHELHLQSIWWNKYTAFGGHVKRPNKSPNSKFWDLQNVLLTENLHETQSVTLIYPWLSQQSKNESWCYQKYCARDWIVDPKFITVFALCDLHIVVLMSSTSQENLSFAQWKDTSRHCPVPSACNDYKMQNAYLFLSPMWWNLF